MSRTQNQYAIVPKACARFFSIPELVRMLLHECTHQVLLNCTLVCNEWKEIVTGTDSLQERLFLKPATTAHGDCRKLNPMLRSHFAPILSPPLQHRETSNKDATEVIEAGLPCTYSDIASLFWARDLSLDAPMRRAFTRSEASWRGMLVSQPPLMRIDWWHEWLYDQNTSNEDIFEASRRGFNEEEVDVDGWGHQYYDREFVTLGMLWDLVESRLARGCLVRVHYFLAGKAVEADPFATVAERRYIVENEPGRRPFAPTTPRVKISSQQIWNNVPWSYAGFDPTVQRWINMPQRPSRITFSHGFNGDGFNALWVDCDQDWENEPCRFSQSEGFSFAGLTGEGGGIVGKNLP